MPRRLKYPAPVAAAPTVPTDGPPAPSVDFVAGLIERMHPRERWHLRLRTRDLMGMRPPTPQVHELPDWMRRMQRQAKRPASERVEQKWKKQQ